MPGILMRWWILTGAVLAASYLMDGIRVAGFFSALGAAAALAILNAFLRPLLILVTLPINVLTLGLFTFVINALLLKMASGLIPGFEVRGFWTAVFGALVVGVASWLLNGFINTRGRFERRPFGGDIIELRERERGKWE